MEMKPSTRMIIGKKINNVGYIYPPKNGWKLVRTPEGWKSNKRTNGNEFWVEDSEIQDGEILFSGSYDACLTEARRITDLTAPNLPLLNNLRLVEPSDGWAIREPDDEDDEPETFSKKTAFYLTRKMVDEMDNLDLSGVPKRVRRMLGDVE